MPVLIRFYSKVRRDPALGPVFGAIVEDWTEHLQRLEDFWSSLMLTSGRYKGKPVAMHVIHANRIQPHMFTRWLELWRETTNDMVPANLAHAMQAKAERIGERLNRAMHGPEALIPLQAPTHDVLEPYRRTRIFDQTTIPPVLLERHENREGTWAVVRVVEARVALHLSNDVTAAQDLNSSEPGFIKPLQPHRLELCGPVRLQIEFFDRDPLSPVRQQGKDNARPSQR